MVKFFILLTILFLSSCDKKPENSSPNTGGKFTNSSNFDVYILTGQALDSKNAAVNGIAVDTASAGSISASIQAILNSTNSLNAVEERDSQYAEYVIDYTAPVTAVPAVFYGAGIQIASKNFLTMPDYRELVRNIHVDIARFPAGQERVRYNRLGLTDASNSFGPGQPYEYELTGEDISNFIDFCKVLNIQAEPEINLYNDDASMWSNMADQVVNELGYDLKYISAGNEPDYNAFSNWTYMNSINITQSFSNYMDRFDRYTAAIGSVKTGISYALSELGSSTPEVLSTKLDLLLGQSHISVPVSLSTHWYMLGDYGQSPDSPDYPSIDHMIVGKNDWFTGIDNISNIYYVMNQKSAQYLGGAKLFIGEWDPAWSGSAASETVQDRLATAIYAAEVLEYTKKLGFESMQYFGLSDPASFYPWCPAIISVDSNNKVSIRPQYYVFMFYKYLWGDKIVNISNSQSENYSIYASLDSNYYYIMTINRSGNVTYIKNVKTITKTGSKNLLLVINPHSVTIFRFK